MITPNLNTLPIIALVGRPNVGKSTLFNRLTQSRDALVADYPGLTRDRQYGQAEYEDQHYIVVDTAGLTSHEKDVTQLMAQQSWQAVEEADVVLFIVDAKQGIATVDEQLAQQLRESGKPVIVVANKTDGLEPTVASAEFFQLGFQQVVPISAAHNAGIQELLEILWGQLPELKKQQTSFPDLQDRIKVAIIGKPNVGKSTLVNRILGEDRVVVFDEPGTTRDSIFIPFERLGEKYTLIDTAGIRRRKNVIEAIEKFSVLKTLQAIEIANVVVMVVDARQGITDQDLRVLGYVLKSGRGLIIAINKWDGLDAEQKATVKEALHRRLTFAEFADWHFISALQGSGISSLFKAIQKTYESANRPMTTNELTQMLERAINDHPPPLVKGRRIKPRYAHPGGHNPPIIVIHGNQVEELPGSYRRYLINYYRKSLKLVGTPLLLQLKQGENPYEGKRNTLTPRQEHKKRRLMRFVKSKK